MPRPRGVSQVPLIANLIDEPPDDSVVELLSALPPEERAYYSAEEHVIERCGKSQVTFEEIQQHYGFVGGSTSEYAAFFHRKDLPARMWRFRRASEAKAI